MSRKYSDECKNTAKEDFIYFEQLCIGEIYTTIKKKKLPLHIYYFYIRRSYHVKRNRL